MNIEHRKRFGSSPALLLAGVVAVAVTLAWPAPEISSTATTSEAEIARPIHEADGPIRLVDVTTSSVWTDRNAAPVKIDVQNTSSQPVRAKIWWLLASPEDSTPWVAPAARGRARRVELSAGSTQSVTVPAPREVPTGTWALSLWAHTVRDNGSTRHSHGASVTPRVHVLPTHPDVYRVGGPGRYTALSVVEPAGRLVGIETDTGPDALVSVSATTMQPIGVQLRCYLARQGTREPWRARKSYSSHIAQSHVEPGAPQAMGCRFQELPDSGSWELSAFIRLGDSDAPDSHEDGLYARRLVALDEGRPAPPAGDDSQHLDDEAVGTNGNED